MKTAVAADATPKQQQQLEQLQKKIFKTTATPGK